MMDSSPSSNLIETSLVETHLRSSIVMDHKVSMSFSQFFNV